MATGLAAGDPLPPLVEPATTDHHVGKIVWLDLVTPDLDSARRFYGGLFGWTFRDVVAGDKNFAVALLGDRPVAGLIQRAVPPGDRKQPAWLTFLAVREAAGAEKTAVAHGAKVITPIREYPRRGRQVILQDPQGAVFAVLESASGDPPDLLAAPGDWIWSSLMTRDPDAGAAFYQELLGYEVFDLQSDDSRQHLLLASDGFARATANTPPATADKFDSHWLNFVRVVSAKDAAARAVSLGGKVLVPPHPDRHGEMVAVLADPAGAPFGVLEWSENETKEVGQ